MVTTRPPKTIVEPTALGTVANTNTKLLIYRLFQKGRVLAQDGVVSRIILAATRPSEVHSRGLDSGSGSQESSLWRRRPVGQGALLGGASM